MKVLSAQQTEALTRLNWLYGRGNIIETVPEYDQATGRGKITLKLQSGTATASFRLVNDTIFYKGHQKTVKS